MLWTLWLGCGTCPPFADTVVTNPDGTATAAQRATAERTLDRFAAWSGREGVCVGEVALHAELDAGRDGSTLGEFVPSEQRVDVLLRPQWPREEPRALQNTLCRALYHDGLSEHPSIHDVLGDGDGDGDGGLIDRLTARRQLEDQLAELCEMSPVAVATKHAIARQCGEDVDRREAFVLDTVFPDLVLEDQHEIAFVSMRDLEQTAPWTTAPVDLDPVHVGSALAGDTLQVVSQLQGALPVRMVIDRYRLPEGDWLGTASANVADHSFTQWYWLGEAGAGLLVMGLYPEQSLRWDGADGLEPAGLPALGPDANHSDGAVLHGGDVWLWDAALLWYTDAAGGDDAWTAAPLPAEPITGLVSHRGELFANGETQRYQWDGGGWVSLGIQAPEYTLLGAVDEQADMLLWLEWGSFMPRYGPVVETEGRRVLLSWCERDFFSASNYYWNERYFAYFHVGGEGWWVPLEEIR